MGKWSWHEAFDHARTIKWWGVIPPSRFYEFSVEDQAYMVVTYQTEMKIQAYQSLVDKAKQEADSLKQKGSGRD